MVLPAAMVWLVAVLLLGTLGFVLGLVGDCTEGMACLNRPLYGALIGAGIALGVLWLFASRLGMAWWWIPTSVLVVVLGGYLGALAGWWLGVLVVLAAPALAGLVSVRGAGMPQGSGWTTTLRGAGAIAAAAALAVGAWWLVELRADQDLVAQVEATGIQLYAAVEREDLAVERVHTPQPEGPVRYAMERRGEAQSWVRIEAAAPGSVGCPSVSRIVCEDLGEGLTVARDPDRGLVTVYRELPDATMRVGPSPGSSRMNGWTEQMLVQLARDLLPVEAAWVVRRG